MHSRKNPNFQEPLEFDVNSTPQQASVRWLAIAEGFVKANWDTVVREKKSEDGIGIEIRDSMGEILACLSSSKPFQSQSFLVESWTLGRTIDLCTELGLQMVQLGGDMQVVISVIHSNEASCSWYRGLIENSKAELSWKTHCRIYFVYKEGNE